MSDTEKAAESVKVNIFNQTYSLRSADGAERLRRIAQVVDERMRMIASQLAVHDVAKVAVLAALNLADELQALKEFYEQEIQASLARARERDAAAGSAQGKAEQGRPAEAERPDWFDTIFNFESPAGGERMSSQVSSRLQKLRQARQGEAVTGTAEGED